MTVNRMDSPALMGKPSKLTAGLGYHSYQANSRDVYKSSGLNMQENLPANDGTPYWKVM